MSSTYLVQTWSDKGALENNYEVTLENEAELRELRKFLRLKTPHFAITKQPNRTTKKR